MHFAFKKIKHTYDSLLRRKGDFVNGKYIITKNGQYLCCSSTDHQMYFGDDREKAMIIQNKRLAADIAYDYRAKAEEI